jgi:aspartyl-tRNA(Asn)/glutamyl-tRNA(Gln) amidotransferase subunit A
MPHGLNVGIRFGKKISRAALHVFPILQEALAIVNILFLKRAGVLRFKNQPRTQEIAGEGVPMLPTIKEIAKRLRDGSLSCETLTRHFLQGICRLDPKLKTFITVPEEKAVTTAVSLDKELRSGKDRGILHGIPIVHKDNCDTAGVPTTVGSEFYRRRVPREDATVVRRLQEAGAVTLGKANMGEFAAGGLGSNSFYGDTRNPWDLSRVPGSSSSGSAVAVAAGLCLGATGTDTGGSIRTPASLCGIVGIRPTYGRVSLAGIYPRATTLDAAGVMAWTVEDVAGLLNAIAGYDPQDPNSLNAPGEDYTVQLGRGVPGIRLGIIKNYSLRDIAKDIETSIRLAIDTFQILGAEIIEVNIPAFVEALDYATLFSHILQYEFSQMLGGEFRAAQNKDRFGPLVQNDIQKGMNISREIYEKTLRDRPETVRAVKEVFREVDALLMPTLAEVAPKYADAAAMAWAGRQRRFNLPVSFTGMPSVSIPCGFSPEGMPVGLQIVGDHLAEASILRIASAFEKATDFHRRRPPVYWNPVPILQAGMSDSLNE